MRPLSLIDYPERLAAVVFCRGCNFLCPFCHNPGLVAPVDPSPADAGAVPEGGSEEVLAFLEKRRNHLDGVVLSGGEPTLQPDLCDFSARVKKMGYAVKLDTNGSRPGALRELVTRGLVDFIAMDVKAPPSKYDLCAGTPVDLDAIRASISFIRSAGVAYQLRTTLVRPFLCDEDLAALQDFIGRTERLTLQACRTDVPLLDSDVCRHPQYTLQEIEEFARRLDSTRHETAARSERRGT
jgi:pyruvate formate lyase activating enzyme